MHHWLQRERSGVAAETKNNRVKFWVREMGTWRKTYLIWSEKIREKERTVRVF